MATVCKSCRAPLAHAKTSHPPVLAIANGNYIGHIPNEFAELNRTDEQAIALVSPCVSLSTVTGGKCRTIKLHNYVVRNTEGPITAMLPRNLSSRVRVTMVGSMTPTQVAICKKRYELDLARCRAFLEFLFENNREYRQYRESQVPFTAGIQRTSIVIDRSTPAEESATEALSVSELRDDTTYSTFGSTVEEGNDASLESDWIGASSLIHEQDQQWADILVRKSNAYVSQARWVACIQMFPSLFPGGCGGPTEPRQRAISVQKWIQRCLHLHDHRFERHYAFLLLAFDYLASKNARETLFVKLHASNQALQAGQVTQQTIEAAIEYLRHMNIMRSKGMKPDPPPEEVSSAIDIWRGLRTPETAFYGSNLSRLRA